MGAASLPWLPGCGGSVSADGGAPASFSSSSTPVLHQATLTVNATATGTPVNRRVLGHNVEWVDGGDNLVDANGVFYPAPLAQVRALQPTVLRYPGGLQSDVFHWQRARNEHVFTGAIQPMLMSTRRVLELCEATGAEPLFTVNVVTGTPEEAAAWVRQTNVDRIVSSATGRLLPRVAFWEIGNEPYLQVDFRGDLTLAPAEFTRRANLFIAAMRAVDASVQIGLPLTLDALNGQSVTPYPGFSRSVAGALTERFDFASFHNAYMPLAVGDAPTGAARYAAAMAGAEGVRDSLARARALVDELRPGAAIPLAVTEHAALFSSADTGSTTPLGAMYVADLLRVLAETPGLLLANHWSLSGNGRFGAIGGQGGNAFNRATADVMALVGATLRGERLAALVECDSVATPSVGLVPARGALPLLSALVCREGRVLRALLIHKDAQRSAQVQVVLGSSALAASISLTTLSTDDVNDTADVPGLWQRAGTAPAGGRQLVAGLPPHSVSLLEMTYS